MGGPIVRTGTTPAFWANWEKAFGKAVAADKKDAATAGTKKAATAKAAKKSPKKKK
jgi:hypothetical protein